jgi:hypothetical protein
MAAAIGGTIIAVVFLGMICMAIYYSVTYKDPAAPKVPGNSQGTTTAPPKPLAASGIFWAVFGALWAFSLSAGLILLIYRLLATA